MGLQKIISTLVLILLIPLYGSATEIFKYKVSYDSLDKIQFDAVMSSKDGNYVLVWNVDATNSGESRSIYAAFIKNKRGKLKAKKSKLISKQDVEDRQEPSIAYNSESDTFFITWFSHKQNGSVHIHSLIEGISLNAKGKAKVKAKVILDNANTGLFDYRPKIASMDKEVFSKKNRDKFAIAYYNSKGPGTCLFLIHSDGKIYKKPMLFHERGQGPDFYNIDVPLELIAGPDGFLYLASKAMVQNGQIQYYSLVSKVSVKGKYLGTAKVVNEHKKISTSYVDQGNLTLTQLPLMLLHRSSKRILILFLLHRFPGC